MVFKIVGEIINTQHQKKEENKYGLDNRLSLAQNLSMKFTKGKTDNSAKMP